MALQAGQRQVELREVLLKDKPTEFLKASPKATVPVLVLENGAVLDESLDIMRWALSSKSASSLLAPDSWWLSALVERNDGEFKQHLDHYKYADRFPEASEIDYRDRAMPDLQHLDQILSQQLYLSGPVVGVLDLAIFPFIRQFVAVDRVWFDSSEMRYLRNWFNGLLESALFLAVMQKYKPWRPGDASVVFPNL